MYPSEELNSLARRKELLLLRISLRRMEIRSAAAGAARPLAWLDQALALWDRFAPFLKLAVVPLAFLLRRPKPGKPQGWLARLLRWVPAGIRIASVLWPWPKRE